MGILDKVRGTFFEDDQPEQHPVAPAPVASIVADVASKPVRVDAGDLASLRNKIKPDSGPLVSFLATLESLKEYIPDEVARYKAASKALAAQGVSLDILSTEIAAALSRLGKEVSKFDAAKAQKLQDSVTSKEASLKSFADQISQFEASIASLRSQRDQLAADISAAKAGIESRETSFRSAVQIVRGEYEDIESKVSAYLGQGDKK